MKNGFVIAGTNSGCGKTTITIGLMRYFSRKGYNVAPFKVGPDYIDPAFHRVASGQHSHNLDSYILPNESVQFLFDKYSTDSDIAIVEGVMGLYDGLGAESLGSTAELARLLQLPVILVVNCKSLYQSVAAIINGFVGFDRNIRIAGVILNHVHSDDQFAFLKQYIQTQCQIPCLGYLPPDKEIALESRHLGLVQANEVDKLSSIADRIVDLLEQHCDTDELLHCTTIETKKASTPLTDYPNLSGLKLAVAYDKAFSFYYQANLDLLQECGAELLFFSPLTDQQIPQEAEALYLGGGYPEVFASELSENQSMIESIRRAVENNMPVYAECGGLMYLTKGIKSQDGTFYPMSGIFNCYTEMTVRLQNFGYCTINWEDTEIRAHEFHHSVLVNDSDKNFKTVFSIRKTEINRQWQGGLTYKNVLAGYPHIHFMADSFFYLKICDFMKTGFLKFT